MHAHQAMSIFEALVSTPHPFGPRIAAGTGSENGGLTEGDPKVQLLLATGMHQ